MLDRLGDMLDRLDEDIRSIGWGILDLLTQRCAIDWVGCSIDRLSGMLDLYTSIV